MSHKKNSPSNFMQGELQSSQWFCEIFYITRPALQLNRNEFRTALNQTLLSTWKAKNKVKMKILQFSLYFKFMKTCSRELTHTTNTCSAGWIIMLLLPLFLTGPFLLNSKLDPGHADPETKASGSISCRRQSCTPLLSPVCSVEEPERGLQAPSVYGWCTVLPHGKKRGYILPMIFFQ